MNFEIILATNNRHKLEEVRQILCPHKIIVYCLEDLNLHPEEIDENGNTYKENALLKALSVAKLTSMPIIADDSGLEIEAMGNEPGIHSARFASSLGGYQQAFTKIWDNIRDKSKKARFVCDIILVNMEDKPLIFEGISEGIISETIRGENGFGYDPIFINEETGLSFAEMDQQTKNKLSHRGKALRKLITYLRINRSIK